MTPTNPFFLIAAIAAVCNLIGSVMSFILFWQNGIDYHTVLVMQVDRPRTQVAWHSFFSEGVRFLIQLSIMSMLFVALLSPKEAFDSATDGLFPLMVWSSCIIIFISTGLLINSFVGLRMRWFVREAIIMDPDPDDVEALDAPLDDPTAPTPEGLHLLGTKARNIQREK